MQDRRRLGMWMNKPDPFGLRAKRWAVGYKLPIAWRCTCDDVRSRWRSKTGEISARQWRPLVGFYLAPRSYRKTPLMDHYVVALCAPAIGVMHFVRALGEALRFRP